MEARRRNPRVAFTLVALLAIAAVLRTVGLNDGLWFDEILTLVQFVRPSLPQIVTEYSSSNNHPLYSVLAHLTVAMFGEHAWALRFPAFLFGVASIPLVYAMGRAVTDRREALLAAALMAVSYHHIWFSQNARGYTALAFFAMLATWVLLKGWRTGNPWYFVWYGVVSALGVYTHLTMAFVVAGQTIVVAWEAWAHPATRRRLTAAAAGFGLAAVGAIALYSPMFADVYAFFSGPPLETAAVATPSWAVRETVRGLRLGLGAAGALVAAGVFALGLWSFWKQDAFVTGLFVLPGAVATAALVVLQSPVRPRFFFFLSGFAILLAIRGTTVAGGLLARMVSNAGEAQGFRLATGLAGVMIVASVVSLPYGYRYPKQDYEGAMRFVDSIATAGVAIATAGLAVYPYRDYYGRPWRALESESDLRDVRSTGLETILVYAFPEYTDAALMLVIARDCRPLKTFPATVAGGDIIVCSIPAFASRGTSSSTSASTLTVAEQTR